MKIPSDKLNAYERLIVENHGNSSSLTHVYDTVLKDIYPHKCIPMIQQTFVVQTSNRNHMLHWLV